MAQQRVLLAELLVKGDPRPVSQVLRDAVTTADALHRYEVGRAAAAGEPVPVDVLASLTDAARGAAALAKLGSDLRLESAEDRARAVGAEVAQVLSQVVDHLGARFLPGFREHVAAVLRAVGEGRTPASSVGRSLLEAEVERRVAQRLGGERLAIGAGASSTVSGPESPVEPEPGLDRDLIRPRRRSRRLLSLSAWSR